MKNITFPDSRTILNENFDLPSVLERFVFNTTIMRQKANHKLCLSLMSKIKSGTDAKSAMVTDAEHELLEKAMLLEGTSIEPRLNAYYMICLGSVYEATVTIEPEPSRALA